MSKIIFSNGKPQRGICPGCGEKLKSIFVMQCVACSEKNIVSVKIAGEIAARAARFQRAMLYREKARKNRIEQEKMAEELYGRDAGRFQPVEVRGERSRQLDLSVLSIEHEDETTDEVAAEASPALADFVTHDSLFAPDDLAPAPGAIEQGARYEKLLLWLSMHGEGSVATLRVACESLGLLGASTPLSAILRRLRLLGHLETSPDGARWMVAPPCLVKSIISGNQTEFFLAGARDERWLEALKRFATLSRDNQPNGEGPTCVTVHFALENAEKWRQFMAQSPEERGQIAPLAACFSAQDTKAEAAALWLGARLPTLAEWTQALPVAQGIAAHDYQLRRWEGDDWAPVGGADAPGFYQFFAGTSGEQNAWELFGARPKNHLLLGDDGLWHSGDWLGLRFAARAQHPNLAPAAYHALSATLAVPQDWRWPELFERALVLASGQLPRWRWDKGQYWLLYPGISPELLDFCALKLPLSL